MEIRFAGRARRPILPRVSRSKTQNRGLADTFRIVRIIKIVGYRARPYELQSTFRSFFFFRNDFTARGRRRFSLKFYRANKLIGRSASAITDHGGSFESIDVRYPERYYYYYYTYVIIDDGVRPEISSSGGHAIRNSSDAPFVRKRKKIRA